MTDDKDKKLGASEIFMKNNMEGGRLVKKRNFAIRHYKELFFVLLAGLPLWFILWWWASSASEEAIVSMEEPKEVEKIIEIPKIIEVPVVVEKVIYKRVKKTIVVPKIVEKVVEVPKIVEIEYKINNPYYNIQVELHRLFREMRKDGLKNLCISHNKDDTCRFKLVINNMELE